MAICIWAVLRDAPKRVQATPDRIACTPFSLTILFTPARHYLRCGNALVGTTGDLMSNHANHSGLSSVDLLLCRIIERNNSSLPDREPVQRWLLLFHIGWFFGVKQSDMKLEIFVYSDRTINISLPITLLAKAVSQYLPADHKFRATLPASETLLQYVSACR